MSILDKPIAILGAGATGQAMAADISLAGKKVHLYELPEFKRGIEDVIKSKKIEIIPGWEINLRDFKRNGIAEIDVATTDMEEALDGVGLIAISVPAVGHKLFFERMIPYLKDGQAVTVFPDNFGSLMLRKMLREKGKDLNIIIGGWSSMPYAARLVQPGKIMIYCRTLSLRGDALPSNDCNKFFEIMEGFPPFATVDIKKGDTVIGIGLDNPNPPVHCPGVLLNVGAIENAGRVEKIYGDDEKKDYDLYGDGISPSVAKVQLQFYKEQRQIAEALGIKIVEYDDRLFMNRGSVMYMAYLGEEKGFFPFEKPLPPVAELRKHGMTTGPWTVQTRYFTEDIPVGAYVAYQLAKKFGVETPVVESVIRLGSVVCGTNFLATGRSLGDLGIADMSKEELLRYLRG